MKKSIILVVIVLSLSSYNDELIAENNIKYDYLIQKSPEATSFERQGRFNVGEYTGTANINVPLYKLQYKDIELPLVINYDSRGVKVNSEASWVGLNWDFNVGGCVSLIPNGGFDWTEVNSRSNYSEILDSIKSQSDYFYTTNRYLRGVVSDRNNGLTELDFYSVALPNASLLFFLDPETKKAIIIGPENGYFTIESEINNSGFPVTNKISAWTVADGNGYIYYFDVVEKSSFRNSEMYNSVWYISKIISPQGNLMEFKYESPSRMWLGPRRSEKEEIELEMIASTDIAAQFYDHKNEYFSHDNHYTEKPYLSSIETKEQTVSFITSEREDLHKGRKLNSIIAKSKLTNDIIKFIKFDYGYFVSNTNTGGDYLEGRFRYLDDKTLKSVLSKRLKLKSVSFAAKGEEDQVYSFGYNESKDFPLKTSCAIDMWGYYNGQENKNRNTTVYKNTMIPSLQYCDINPVIVKRYSNDGGNRLPNEKTMDAFILTQITYPTKGYTIFQYEPNSYRKYFLNNLAAGTAGSNNVESFAWFVSSVSIDANHQEITFQKDFTGKLTAVFQANSGNLASLEPGTSLYVELYRIGQESYKNPKQYKIGLSGNDNVNVYTTNNYTKSIDVDLPKGTYMLVTSISSKGKENGYVSGKLENSNPVTIKSGYETAKGAGLRIKAINSYDKNGTKLESTEYKYTNSDGTSSGKLINPLGFDSYTYFVVEDPNWASIYGILRLGSSAQRLTSFASIVSPNDVGYSRVEKFITTIDGQRKKEISYFQNDTIGCNIDDGYKSSIIRKDNGNLIKKEYIDDYNNIIREENYEYNVPNYESYKMNYIIEPIFPNNLNYDYGRNRISVYSFHRFQNRLKTRVVNEYVNDDDGKMYLSSRDSTSYSYDAINHQLKTIENTVLGTNTFHNTDYIYTSTDSSSTSQDMMNKHHIANAVVQKTESAIFNGVKTKIITTRNQYQLNYGNYRLSSTSESVGSYNMRERVRYGYFDNGNVKSIVKDSTNNIVYLWSYQGNYPIAKIEGLTYSIVEGILTSSFISVLQSKSEPSVENYNTIRSSLSDAGGLVTTYTYKPLVGMTSQTMPNGTTTKFDYDGFGRLMSVWDTKGKVISSYQYHNNK